jgi:hypothetical protein
MGNGNEFDLLKDVLTINNKYRIMYELDEREKVNNITFGESDNVDNGQTEEELKDQDNGSTV